MYKKQIIVLKHKIDQTRNEDARQTNAWKGEKLDETSTEDPIRKILASKPYVTDRQGDDNQKH
jgi:hypothetical protein